MSFDVTTTPPIGDSTKQNDYIRLRDAIKADSAAGSHDFHGSHTDMIPDTSFVDLPGSVEIEIDGTNFSGLSVFFEVNAYADPGNAAAGSPQFRLFNVTAGGAVSGSTVTVTSVSPGTRKRAVSTAVTLNTALNTYKPQILSDNAARRFAGKARVTIRG